MPYDPSQPAQLSISGVGKKHFIQNGVRYAHFAPHEPLDAKEEAEAQARMEADRMARAPRIALHEGESLVHLGRGVYIVEGPSGERGPFREHQVAHLLDVAGNDPAPTKAEPASMGGEALVLKEGETIRETKDGSGWFHVLNQAGEPTGPAYPKKRVAHLLGDA